MTIDDFLRRIANSWDHAGLNTTYTSLDVGEKPFPIPCSTVQDRFLMVNSWTKKIDVVLFLFLAESDIVQRSWLAARDEDTQ